MVAQILTHYVDYPVSHPYALGWTAYGDPRGNVGDGTFTICQTVSCRSCEQNHASSGSETPIGCLSGCPSCFCLCDGQPLPSSTGGRASSRQHNDVLVFPSQKSACSPSCL